MVKIAPNSAAKYAGTPDALIAFDPIVFMESAIESVMESPPFWTAFDSRESLRVENMGAILHPIAGRVHGEGLNCYEAI
jgi:hypothetical protein